MSAPPSAILKLLLSLVPACPGLIRRGHLFEGIYDTILGVIADYGTDEQVEWEHLAMIVRQDQALLAAEARGKAAPGP